MKKIRIDRVAVIICLLICFGHQTASACKYNIRDVGFADLGDQRYHFYTYINDQTSEDFTSALKRACEVILAESNVNIEIINIDRQKDHPATKHLGCLSAKSFPAAVLVSPDDRPLPISIVAPDKSVEQVLMSIAWSPKRREIIEQTSKTYGVVLLIESDDPEKNKTAQDTIKKAINLISKQMAFLPKSIAEPPVMVVLGHQLHTEEKILLWSLGLEPEKINAPYAAILYGRAKQIGPVLENDKITEDILANILFLIGQDCECDLDPRWMQGLMLPVRWDSAIQQRVAKSLGFDPESPMIKMEMARILRRGSAFPSVPIGYQQRESDPNSKTQNSYYVQGIPLPDPIVDPPTPAKADPTLRKSLYTIAALAVLALGIGLFIILAAAGKKQ